ncbi:sulfite exporter TauE/SafE family protein [bacterium]|nr:MAG: sulfite exporter TauE/SafE family protein [bacterium]
MDGTRITILLGAGALAGLMNSIAGGGTIVTFPALILAGLPSIVANATSTVALLPGTLSSLAGYRKNIPSVSRWLRLFAPVSLVGGLVGGILLVQTPSSLFDQFVPFLILFATILFMAHSSFSHLFSSRQVQKGSMPSRRWVIGAMVFQLGVAIYGGYFGAGIGILMLASLGMLGFENVHEMNTVKAVLGFMINVVAAVYFITSGLIGWAEAGIMAAGTILGGYSGAYFAQKVEQVTVRRLITAVGLGISALMFYKQA